jgi:UDP-glucuronate decarboxylase
MINGAVEFMRSPADLTGPINFGNPSECTILDLARTIIRLTRSSSEIVHLSASQDDPKQRQPDISLARAALEWTPRVALEEGLKTTISYFQRSISG